jgi:hypothetical protein
MSKYTIVTIGEGIYKIKVPKADKNGEFNSYAEADKKIKDDQSEGFTKFLFFSK